METDKEKDLRARTASSEADVAPSSSGAASPSSLADMFVTFLKIGAFTFGGGWAMISIIEREVVTRHHWLGKEEFLDLLAVSQSLPGILAVNIAVAVGDRIRGRAGCYACAAGTMLPSFVIILAIAAFLTPEAITGNATLSAIFKGIRPAVVALIIAPVINAAKAAHLNMVTVWIPVIVALAIWSSIPVISNPILWIVIAIVAGIMHLKGYFKFNRKGGEKQ